jgi:PAS domain S-box-containing protein
VPLDAATRFIQSAQGVVPWYPPAALTVALLLVFGLRYAPVVLLTVTACKYFVWDLPPGPLHLGPLFLSISSVTIYSAAAALLRYGLRIRTDLTRLSDAAWFVLVIALASTATGAVFATYLLATGSVDGSAHMATLNEFALGDMVGIFTLAPAMLLVGTFPGRRPRDKRKAPGEGFLQSLRFRSVVVWRSNAIEVIGWSMLLLASLWIALDPEGQPVGNRLYFTFVPLIWAALRLGNRGSATAVLLIACTTIVAIMLHGYHADLAELQLYLLALALTGLFLGAAVTEHKKAHEMWRRYEFIANAPGELMALVDRDYRIEAVNDAFCRIHKCDKDAIIGQAFANVWGVDAFQFTIRTYLERCFEGRTEVTEGWYRTASLGRRYFRFVYSPYIEKDKRITHSVVVAHDLTEKQLADRAQEKTENLYRRAIAASDAVPYVRDYSEDRDEFLFMGPEIERLTGYSAGELTTKMWESIQLEVSMLGKMKGLPYDEAVSRTRAGEFKYWRSDNRLRTKDGSERWVTDASVEIQDDEGTVVGSIGILSDITERKRAEETLRQSEERLELALRGADLGLWDWDITNDRLTVNERFAAMLGYAPEELIPAGYAMRSHIHPEDRALAVVTMRKHLNGEAPNFEAEYRIRKKSGEYIWVLNRGRVFERDADGEPLRALGTHLDITHRHEVETERRKLEIQMQHAQKLESLGILAGGIAHDFNNLLVGILGNADLAIMDREQDADREYLEAIVSSAQRAAELCRQMLAYSGKGRFIVQPIDLNDVVREMAHLLSVSVSKRATLHYDFASGLPAVEVDVTQMRQIIMNLITNASESIGDAEGIVAIGTAKRYLDENTVRSIYLGDELPAGEYVALEIRDTGCGMDSETKARMFDPFFTTKFTGRGLGMAAVLGIIRGHRGAVDVQSTVGVGTTITVLIPASEQAAHSLTRDIGTQEQWTSSGRVLVVDDEPQVLELISKLLMRAGFTPVLSRDGREALELFGHQSDSIRLVLLDMLMPRMSCAETIREMRRIHKDVPIILTSGYSEPDATRQFHEDEIAGFLQKPFRAQVLYEVVRRAIEA